MIKKNPKEVLSIFLLKDNKHKWAINSGKDGGEGERAEGISISLFMFYSFLSKKAFPSGHFLPLLT